MNNENKLYNDYVTELEHRISINYSDKKALLQEIFLCWYLLVEGNESYFNKPSILNITKRNLIFIKEYHKNDDQFDFIIGWMTQISPWYFDESIDSCKLLSKAYKKDSKNLLYKWSLRSELNLSAIDIKEIEKQIANNFEVYFMDFEPIKKYFLELFS